MNRHPRNRIKEVLLSHKKQYFIYNVIKTKKIVICKKTLGLVKLLRNRWNLVLSKDYPKGICRVIFRAVFMTPASFCRHCMNSENRIHFKVT